MLIFQYSKKDRLAKAQLPHEEISTLDLPAAFLRQDQPLLPEVSELDVVRHYTRLSQKNFSIDTHFYPLGSCTMKYNPRGIHQLSQLDGFLQHHPLSLDEDSQGFMIGVYELQEFIKVVTGMTAVSLTPMAGAQGELAGVAMIRAYHHVHGDQMRDEILVPDAAHGTNPASAVQCGFKLREIPTDAEGDVDLSALQAAVGPKTAGMMLTNPSTLGVFERNIVAIADIVHQAGGLLYYDGANLNAILGKVRPVDMGFDVIHLNLHKTFATPHGGGGPGCGPVAANKRLAPFLPVPMVTHIAGKYRWLTLKECPQSIGRLSAFMGNAGIILRAQMYAFLLGREGLKRIAEFATLNANYLLAQLKAAGFTLAYPTRLAAHELIITCKTAGKNWHITALDIAKRLLDYGFHAPTMYFPLLVPECLLIEPTETETKQTLDAFVTAMVQILTEAETAPELLKHAPHHLPVKRLDEVKAARQLDVAYRE